MILPAQYCSHLQYWHSYNIYPLQCFDTAVDWVTRVTFTYAHTHSVLTAIFPGKPVLAGCPLNSPSPVIPGLRIRFGQA